MFLGPWCFLVFSFFAGGVLFDGGVVLAGAWLLVGGADAFAGAGAFWLVVLCVVVFVVCAGA